MFIYPFSRFHKRLLNKNNLYIYFAIILFLIPFIWLPDHKLDLGGDSSRLYFYSPNNYLKNLALFSPNAGGTVGYDVRQGYFFVPYLLLLVTLRHFLSIDPHLLINLSNGFVLSGAFLSVYFILGVLLRKIKIGEKQMVQIIGGLFFTLSPVIILDWNRALYNIYSFFIYPLLFLTLLKYIETNKFIYLWAGSLITSVFAINFNVTNIPWLLSFSFFSVVFFLVYGFFVKKLSKTLLALLIFLLLFFASGSFYVIPRVADLARPDNNLITLAFNKTKALNRGLIYFNSIYPSVKLKYNLMDQVQYQLLVDFNSPAKEMFVPHKKYMPFAVIYPIVILLAMLINKEEYLDKLLILNLLIFIPLLFFMTGNITPLAIKIYQKLFYIPGFAMFRHYIGKFAMAYAFFFSITFSIGLVIVLKHIKNRKISIGLIFFTLLLITLNGSPLLSGEIIRAQLWQSRNVSSLLVMNKKYKNLVKIISKENSSDKMISLPFTDENYQLLRGEGSGVYFGPHTIPVLVGEPVFAGIGGFGKFGPIITKLLENNDVTALGKIFSFLDVREIMFNSDQYIYTNFPGYPYSDFLKQKFKTGQAVRSFISQLNWKLDTSLKPFYIYKNKYFLPHFYLPHHIIYSPNKINALPGIVGLPGYKIRSAIYLGRINELTNSKINELKNRADEVVVEGKMMGREGILDIGKINQLQHSLPIAYPKYRPGSWQWRLALLKEKYDLWKMRKKPAEERMKKWLFYGDKRINEIKKFQITNNKSQINSKSQIPNLKDIILGNLSPFQLWQGDMNKAWDILQTWRGTEKFWPELQVFKAAIDRQQVAMQKISTRSESWQEWQEAIQKWQEKVAAVQPGPDFSQLEYEFNLPREGNYEIYIEKIPNYKYQITNKSQMAIINNVKGNWIDWGRRYFKKGQQKLVLPIRGLSRNLLDRQLGVKNYQGSRLYRLNLDYRNGSKSVLEIVENQNDKTPKVKQILPPALDELKHFSLYFHSSPEATLAAVRFSTVNGKRAKLEYQDLSLKQVLEPKLVLRSRNADNTDKEARITRKMPRIEFVKINPTKYRIKVTGAREPYTLVFSESFHKGWHLYLKNQLTNSKINGLTNYLMRMLGKIGEKITGLFLKNRGYGEEVASYFDGEIKEGTHRMTFLEPATFETWGKKPIAEDRHYLVNGYANSWYIKPSDVGGRENYELIVEFWPQRLFYIGLAISLATLISSLGYLGYVFLIKRLKD